MHAAEEARKAAAAAEASTEELRAAAAAAAAEQAMLREALSEKEAALAAAEAVRESERSAQAEALSVLRSQVEALQGDVARVTKQYENVSGAAPVALLPHCCVSRALMRKLYIACAASDKHCSGTRLLSDESVDRRG